MHVHLKRHFWLLNLGTVVACAVLAARATTHYVEGRYLRSSPGPIEPVASATPPRAADRGQQPRSKHGQRLAARNMFCHECGPPEPSPPPGPPSPGDGSEGPPETELPLRLVATHVSAPQTASVATVVNTSSELIGAYRVNGRIPDAGDVVRITGKYIDFRNSARQRVERLSLLRSAAPAGPPKAVATKRSGRPRPRSALAAAIDEGIRRVDDTHFEIDRELANRLVANPSALRGAKITTSFKEGKPDGVRLYAVRPSSAFARLGLQNGDTIHAINGFSLASPDDAFNAYANVRNANNLALTVTRHGKPVTLSYVVQ